MAYLEVKNLKKGFGSAEVLKDVSFTLEKGQVLAILGSSGSGKTTLLRCLNYLETADSGSICLEGRTLTGADRLEFGLGFQNFNLFPQYTALENVELAPRRLGREPRGMELLARVGLAQKADLYPWQLSGGQQQRVAIARALAREPKILCFDEPTSALDPELTGEVLRVIRGLKEKNTTMILVTHEMEFAKSAADVIIYMYEGRIEEVGTPEQIFSAPRSERTRRFLEGF